MVNKILLELKKRGLKYFAGLVIFLGLGLFANGLYRVPLLENFGVDLLTGVLICAACLYINVSK